MTWVAKTLLAKLHARRKFYREHGHKVDDIAIGHYEGKIKIADDTGAYDFELSAHNPPCWYARRVGNPSRTTEWIASYCSGIIAECGVELCDT